MGVRLALISFVLACCVTCSGSPTGPDEGVSIEIRGQIWGRVYRGQQNPAGPLAADTYVDPVAGAVISTSLDSATATSDGSGNFVLRTTRGSGGQAFQLRISAAGYPTYDRSGCWGGPNYKIALVWNDADPLVSVPC
jgi:hypothetical protein